MDRFFDFPGGSETPIRDARYPRIQNFNPLEVFIDVRSEALRNNRLYEDPSFGNQPHYFNREEMLEWRRPQDIVIHPQFRPEYGKPTRFDCVQYVVNDCALIAAIEAMTLNEELLNHVVPDGQSFSDPFYCGAFHFRIWQRGAWYDVVVDDRLPYYIPGKQDKFQGVLGARSKARLGNIFWGSLLEKAYAKIYAYITNNTMPSYHSIEFQDVNRHMQDLSGGITERFPLDPEFVEVVSPDHRGKSLRDLMVESYERGDMMCAVLNKVKNDKLAEQGLMDMHVYPVTKVVWFKTGIEVKDKCIVRIMNPWGTREWRGPWCDECPEWSGVFGPDRFEWDLYSREKFGAPIRDDGESWMELSKFAEAFDHLSVCNLEPTGYLLNRNIYIDNITWHTVEVRGEWIEGVSAVGPELSMLHENPQFMFFLDDSAPDFDEKKNYDSVIDLSNRGLTTDYNEAVSFFVYFGISHKLTKDDIEEYSPENEDPYFASDNSNSECLLVPGKFIVIPCTEGRNIESKFLLRIFSPCPLKYVDDSGSKLSKPLPLEEQSALESNAIPMRMFIDSAQKNSEIDWVGLKKMLQEVFNPNGSFFGMLLTLFKNVQAYFDVNLSRSSDEYENDTVIFTKDECRRMIAMLDEDNSGKLNISEFCNLWKKICFWIKVYDQYKDEEKGYLKTGQLRDALGAIGYDVNKRILHTVNYVYSNEQGEISFTDFILCGVTLETTLTLVEKSVVKDKSKITFTLEEWVKKTVIL